MIFDTARWQARLDELRAKHHVPGASLAVLCDGRIHELASGVLHRGTGVTVTTDSVFQLGSIAKTYTATLVMQLVDAGRLDLDARVVDVLPGFAVADPVATQTVTVRQLLSHTSGISGDFTLDTGRGDDCLARYVSACVDVGQDCPPGMATSYSSTGYNILGRIVEVVTGQVWDAALADRLLAPLGLSATMTLPEDVLRFRAAMGHLGEPGRYPEPAPVWDFLPRSAGPYGRVCATAADVVRFAHMHLRAGKAADGSQVLSAEAVAAMQRREVDVPDKWTVSADAWGLGWTLYDWSGVKGFGHDGSAVSQLSYLRVVPDAGVAIALLTNGSGTRLLYADLFADLLDEVAGIQMPAPFGPPEQPVAVDMGPYVGTYKREGVVITVSSSPDGKASLRYEFVDGMRHFSPPLQTTLVPVSPSVFAATGAGASFSEDWMPVVFSTLPDRTPCVYVGMRAAPRANGLPPPPDLGPDHCGVDGVSIPDAWPGVRR
jgi:CubicO group peptidase (beta-lactamase class C family)